MCADWCKISRQGRLGGPFSGPCAALFQKVDRMPENMSSGETAPSPVFSAREVLCHPESKTEGDLLEAMVGAIASGHDIGSARTALEAVMERQASSATFIAPGVAMPHARIEGVGDTYVAVATCPDGIAFGGSDVPVRLAILVLTPKDSPAGYLKVASGIARKIAEPGFVKRVVALASPELVAAEFSGSGSRIDGEVIARDLMVAAPAVLRETNSVKEAIDTIVRTGRSEIPVVDKEGARM